MSNKPNAQLNALDLLVRRTARCGMTDGTVMAIEFISGFEKFNTRPYHNYDTWAQGWRVHGLGVSVEREDLDDAVIEWAQAVDLNRAGQPIPPYAVETAGTTLPDWIEATTKNWNDGVPK